MVMWSMFMINYIIPDYAMLLPIGFSFALASITIDKHYRAKALIDAMFNIKEVPIALDFVFNDSGIYPSASVDWSKEFF